MTQFVSVSSASTPPERQACAEQLAAEAVLAHVSGRAPGRVLQVQLWPAPAIEYAVEPDPTALQGNRALLEDLVMAALAPRRLAARSEGRQVWPAARCPAALLSVGLSTPQERAVADAYLTVLGARTDAELERYCSAVQVVAYALQERGRLSGEEVGHHVFCAQQLRARLLN